jgi:hypothetical protein
MKIVMTATLPSASDNNHLAVNQFSWIRPKPRSRVTRRIRVSRVRTSAVLAVLGCGFSVATACSAPNSTENPAAPLPSAVRAACGHPGSTVTLERLPVTIRHADCDLTGVEVRYGMTGLTVPSSEMVGAAADGISSSTTLVVEVDPTIGDVTFHD